MRINKHFESFTFSIVFSLLCNPFLFLLFLCIILYNFHIISSKQFSGNLKEFKNLTFSKTIYVGFIKISVEIKGKLEFHYFIIIIVYQISLTILHIKNEVSFITKYYFYD